MSQPVPRKLTLVECIKCFWNNERLEAVDRGGDLHNIKKVLYDYVLFSTD